MRRLSILVIGLMLASCGEPERARPVAIAAHAVRAGSEFDGIGKITLFQGESCASQIMFVFHAARSASAGLRRDESGSISMAAPFKQSKILTDAARDDRIVHVWGKWRRGKASGCSYVEATEVETQKSFW
ncbi:MAG TPA: hypothetical protein VKE30_07665 [Chthoniobacterales bacterium]|nr:hypothetical protein [Chthoniobacterales bacterium]